MTDPFVGEIMWTPYNFAPAGWAMCNGQLMAINQNTALFSLLGTSFGGDGFTTFGLPDLRSRVPIHNGVNPSSQTPYVLGQVGGEESVTLLDTTLPGHTHQAIASNAAGTTSSPSGAFWAASSFADGVYSDLLANIQMSPIALAPSGPNFPHENRMPILALNFCIALTGVFPSRS